MYRGRIALFEEGELIEGKDGIQNVKLEIDLVGALDGSLTPASKLDGTPTRIFESFRVSGKGSDAGRTRMKKFIVAACGYADAASYNADDPEGWKMDYFLGETPPDDYDVGPLETLVGRLVDFEVTQGNPIVDQEGTPKMYVNSKGETVPDFYRNYRWEPVPEEDQETAAAAE